MYMLWDDGNGHIIERDAEGDYHIVSFAGAEHNIRIYAIERMKEFKIFDDLLRRLSKKLEIDDAFNIFLQAIEHKYGEPTEEESMYDRARDAYKDSHIYGRY